MPWERRGTVAATDEWQQLGRIKSTGEAILKVSYSGVQPRDEFLRGFFRQRFEPIIYDARWYNLYPKPIENDVYFLPIPDPYRVYAPGQRFLEVRKWRGASLSLEATWQVHIDEWVEEAPILFGGLPAILLISAWVCQLPSLGS
ncbi:MAG: hypothetical protein HC816_21840 [Leptolyngbyaceae cyanobacterium RM1_1_2]|nr:hypothetical protein [Leptolyngbyaceae cyanobacterium RM1_1_2]